MPWTPSYNPGSSIGSQNHVTPPSGGNYSGFNLGFSGTYQGSGYSDGMYERMADDANGNHIWEFFITRRSHDSGWLGLNNTPNHAIRWTGTQWEDHDTTGSNTYPTSVTLNGTTVELYDGSNIIGTFTHPYTSGGGTSTEGVPIVQWSASFSKDPGSNYWRWTVTGLNTDATDYIYLYDYMPTTTSTEPAIMTRTFAASSTSSTQYGLFTPDETKTYYVINYHGGSSSTNTGAVVLASKSFANKKVFCNFW